MTNERQLTIPQRLIEQYQLILMTMSALHYDFACGKAIDANCHIVARAIGSIFPDFKVVDGKIPRLATLEHGEEYGCEMIMRPKVGPVFMGRFMLLSHSWLAWREEERFILDVWPIGGVPGASPPVLLYQDQWATTYEASRLPVDVTEESLLPLVEVFSERFKKTYKEMFEMFSSQKAA